MKPNITPAYGSYNLSTRPGKIEWIVIHYTAGTTSAKGAALANCKYYGGGDRQASADFFVDDEEICQYNPSLQRSNTWAVGGSKLVTSKGGRYHGICKNSNSVSVEMCSTNDTGSVTNANDGHWSVTEAVYLKTVALVRWLMEELGIDADHVIRHYDVTGKLCPGIIGWNENSGDTSAWKQFQRDIREAEMEDGSVCSISIPLHLIDKLSIVMARGRSMEDVKADTGADIIINGGYFDNKGRPVAHLKVDGEVKSSEKWCAWAYAWDQGPDIQMLQVPGKGEEKSNYISCKELFTPWDGKDKPLKYDDEIAGKRGRSGIGVGGGNLILCCVKDGTKSAMTPEELREKMAKLGAENALMLDGGNSSQCDFGEQKVTSDTKVCDYICVWLKGKTDLEWAMDNGLFLGVDTTGPVTWEGLAHMFKNFSKE